MNVKLLDCSLRDGGHVTGSYFGEKTIKGIISNFVKAGMDYIELGFLKNCEYHKDYALFNGIDDVKKIIEKKPVNGELILMLQEDQYDISKLEKCDGTVTRIRVSFHCYDIEEGFECCKQVMEKGYKCHVNPINIMGYSDDEILAIIKRVNDIKPSVFSIVDTFGAMTRKDLLRIFYLIDHNLSKNIELGIHLHENMAQSFSLAQTFIEANTLGRNIIIDGSLLGMGKAPGNLCIELIMDYINQTIGNRYNIDTIYDSIDDYIKPIRKQYKWGYSPEFALSAQFNLHRTYAEYLQEKGKLRTKDIRQILGQISNDKKVVYDKSYIENLYMDYMDVSIDDEESISTLAEALKNKEILIVAPGISLVKEKSKIEEFIVQNQPLVISANFICPYYFVDYAFFTSLKRIQEIDKKDTKIIGTSNLMHSEQDIDYLINQHALSFFNGVFYDNCVLMLLNLLRKLEFTKCYIAGFDGFGKNENFYDKSMENIHASDNDTIKRILGTCFNSFDLQFITKSKYTE